MFTGIITHTTKVVSSRFSPPAPSSAKSYGRAQRGGVRGGGSLRVQFEKPRDFVLKKGDSVNINGICSTVVQIAKSGELSAGKPHSNILQNVGMWFDVEYMEETIARTTVDDWKKGTKVNLELPLRANDRLGGHIVQGHIDFAGRVLSLSPFQRGSKRGSDHILRISLPAEFKKYIIQKGSVTINGVSLTVSGKNDFPHSHVLKNMRMRKEGWFEVSLIEYTRAHTNLGSLEKGDRVNVEVDIVGKYVVQLIKR